MKKGFLLFLIVAAASGAALAEQVMLGDLHDGARSESVHLIPLFDEQQRMIYPDDDPAMPFSMRATCSDCHDYDLASGGWHFNAVDPEVSPGRQGQPWLLVDSRLGVQVPLSYRDWPGVFHPEQFGISTFEFTTRFGRQMPGGGPGEIPSEEFDELMRAEISGPLEVNCFTCHSGHYGQDHAEWADQIRRQNLRWAATGASEFASVTGYAIEMHDFWDYEAPTGTDFEPTVIYRRQMFDHADRVLLDVGGRIDPSSCYQCHSNKFVSADVPAVFNADQDVHLHAGMSCVDCHTNDAAHEIVRGYEGEHLVSGNPMAAASTCAGCHLGVEGQQHTTAGRFSAPVPDHKGIPPVHFDAMTCTACHSGLWPEQDTANVLTSRGHALGTHESLRADDALPSIITPVFVTGSDGKLGPANLIWPAYWAIRDDNGLTPIEIDQVRAVAGSALGQMDIPGRGWPEMTESVLESALSALGDQAVYVANGMLHYLDDDNNLVSVEDQAAEPYTWPIAHNVRPAAQSLGVRGCEDCHSVDSPITFGNVAVDGPLTQRRVIQMSQLQDLDATYLGWFAWSWMFRNMLKVVSITASAIIAVVLLLYGLKALACISGAKTEQ